MLPTLLLREEGIALLDRFELGLRSAKHLERNTPSGSLTYRAVPLFSDGGDVTLLRITLTQGTRECLVKAQQAMEEKKKETMTERDMLQRGVPASAVLSYATASGSLDLLEDALKWARRFDRDYHTVQTLYGPRVISEDMAELLSAVKGKDLTASQLGHNIAQANRLIEALIQTGCDAVAEPSYNQYDWRRVFDIFALVVVKRLIKMPQLQKLLCLSDDDVYNIVWAPTLEMAIRTETLLLRPRYECYRDTMRLWQEVWVESKLNRTTDRDWSTSDSSAFTLTKEFLTSSAARFIDQLCERRYELYKRARFMKNASVPSIDGIWAAGLSLNHLMPFKLDKDAPVHLLPFVVSQAAKIVFLSKDIALRAVPQDEDNQAQHIEDAETESYAFATKIWIRSGHDQTQRKGMLLKALDYIVSVTESLFLSRDDAKRYWLDKLANLDDDLSRSHRETSKYQKLPMNLLPSDQNPDPIEWNPESERPTLRKRAPLLLDVIAGSTVSRSVYTKSTSSTPKVVVKSPEQRKLMASSLISSAIPAETESLIAMALLILESHHKLGHHLLASPYPTLRDVRYPAVYLDHEFLEKAPIGADLSALGILRAYCNDLPISLILRLIDSLQKSKRTTEEHRSAVTHAFELLNTIVDGDRPGAALDIIVHSVFAYPEQSSWHRWILRKRLFNSLPADAALRMMHSLADQIKTRLRYMTAQAGAESRDMSLGVKITTVKLFIELLTTTKCVSEADVVDILCSILPMAHNIDVRTAIIEQLGILLQTTQQPQLQTALFDALGKVVPIAAEFDERRPMTEADWAEAEKNATIQIHAKSQNGDMPDTMTALVEIESLLREPECAVTRQAYLDKIILPLLHRSIQNNQRWMRIFLASQHKSPDSMPAMPIQKALLKQVVLRFHDLVDTETFALFDNYIRVTINLPPTIFEMNAHLQGPSDLDMSDASKHWLSMWNTQVTSWIHDLCSLLVKSRTKSDVEMQRLQQYWRRWATRYVHAGTKLAHVRDAHTKLLAIPSYAATDEAKYHWIKWCRPLLIEYVDQVQQLRSTAWQRDSNRVPDALPDTFKLSVDLLPHPHFPYYEEQTEKCAAFVREVIDKIEAIATGRPYHKLWPQITDVVVRLRGTKYQYEVGMALANVGKNAILSPTLADQLRIELAVPLLIGVVKSEPNNDEDLAADNLVRDIAWQWRDSPVEEIREHARTLAPW